MPIITHIDEQRKKMGYTVKELAEKVGITPPNLSKIIHGKVFELKLSTLENLCKALQCQIGDMFEYKENGKPKIIPLFLDFSGTTDKLLDGGAENVKEFFDYIKSLQERTGSIVQITMITGTAYLTAKCKYKPLRALAQNYGVPDLFDGVVAEYCGHWVRANSEKHLLSMDTDLLKLRPTLETLIKQYKEYGAVRNDKVSSYDNVIFEKEKAVKEIDRSTILEFNEKVLSAINKEFGNDINLETRIYYDEYGKECDIKPIIHSKAQAVYMILKELKEKYEIQSVIIGGDSQEEDLIMYTENKHRLEDLGMKTVFIAPSNIGKISSIDKDIIIGRWQNFDGITDALKKHIEREYGG